MPHPRSGLVVAALLLAACHVGGAPSTDAGVTDAGTTDAGTTDAGTTDAGGTPPPPREPQGTERIPAYLRASPYSRLVLEVDSTQGFAPSPLVENAIQAVLAAETDKPGGITLVRDQTLPRKGPSYEWSLRELFELADETYNLPPPEDAIRIHALFLDGQYQQGQVLGLAWGHKHLVIFRETIERYCRFGLAAPLDDQVCRYSEQAVWTHELGHVLGLVNNGLEMTQPHEDSQHPHHDHNDQCVMYWAFATPDAITLLVQRILGDEPVGLQFDEACRADLAAGRATP